MALDKEEDDTKLTMGCSVAELKAHINKQLDPDMSWDTFGENWHIVHKMEIWDDNPSDTAEHRISAICNRLHYTNTEPVWAKDLHRGSMMRVGSVQSPTAATLPPPSYIEEKTEKEPRSLVPLESDTVVTLHQ